MRGLDILHTLQLCIIFAFFSSFLCLVLHSSGRREQTLLGGARGWLALGFRDGPKGYTCVPTFEGLGRELYCLLSSNFTALASGDDEAEWVV